jgi:hypothetical protein
MVSPAAIVTERVYGVNMKVAEAACRAVPPGCAEKFLESSSNND